MTSVDYDPEIAARLDAALRGYRPMPRLGRAASRRRSRSVLAATLVAAAVVVMWGAGREIEAAAASNGFECVDAVTKARLYTQALSATLPNLSEQQRQAAKQQVAAEIRKAISETCGDAPLKKGTPP